MELCCLFQPLVGNEYFEVVGGANGTIIVSGVVTAVGGIIGCYVPGGQAVGACGIVAGVTTIIAGIIY